MRREMTFILPFLVDNMCSPGDTRRALCWEAWQDSCLVIQSHSVQTQQGKSRKGARGLDLPNFPPAVQVSSESVRAAEGLRSQPRPASWQCPERMLLSAMHSALELCRPLLSGKADLHRLGQWSLKGGMLASLSLLKVPSEGSQSAISLWLPLGPYCKVSPVKESCTGDSRKR